MRLQPQGREVAGMQANNPGGAWAGPAVVAGAGMSYKFLLVATCPHEDKKGQKSDK